MNRAGVLNYWFYDEDFFDFEKGHLTFKGRNGHGKSVSMQSLLPLLLDGDKRPHRLDPFGTRDKKMLDYLVIEGDDVDPNKISYIFLEYHNHKSGEYITTGLGLKPKSNKSGVDSWGFILKNGKRVGDNFSLCKKDGYDRNGNEIKTPLTKKELRKSLEESDSGKVTDTQTEYAEEVNKHIFKFDTLETFLELTNLIIQIRTPKLSKGLKTDVIYDILNKSLPELTQEDINPLSSTIKDIDEQKRKLEKTKLDLSLVEKLTGTYNDYNETLLADASNKFLSVLGDQEKKQSTFERLKKTIAKKTNQLEETEQMISHLESESEAITSNLNKLETSEIRSLNDDLQMKQKKKDDSTSLIENKNNGIDKKESSRRHLESDLDSIEHDIYTIDKEAIEQKHELNELASQSYFSEHIHFIDNVDAILSKNETDTAFFKTWISRINDHKQTIKKIIAAFREENESKQALDHINQTLEEAHSDLSTIDKKKLSLEKTFDSLLTDYEIAIGEWSEMNHVFSLEKGQLARVIDDIKGLYDVTTPDDVFDALNTYYMEHLRSLHFKQVSNESNIETLSNEKRRLEDEKTTLHNQKEPEPSFRHEKTEASRKHLDVQGIPYCPFYEAVEFKPDISHEERERFESAFIDTGILDALLLPEAYHHSVTDNDRFLIPKQKTYPSSLLSVLEPVCSDESVVSRDDVSSFLASISVNEEDDACITSQGKYRYGSVKGIAVERERSIYIGKEARIQHKEEQLKSLGMRISSIEKEIHHYTSIIASIADKVSTLKAEKQSIPSMNGIKKNQLEKESVQQAFERMKNNINSLETKRQERNNHYKTKRQERLNLSETFSSIHSLETFLDVEEGIDLYKDETNALHTKLNQFIYLEDRSDSITSQIEKTDEDISDLRDEVSDLQRSIKKLDFEITTLNQALEALGIKDIEEQIKTLRLRKQDVDKEYKHLLTKPGEYKAEIKSLTNEKETLEQHVTFMTWLKDEREKLFRNELRLNDLQGESELNQEEIKDLALSFQNKSIKKEASWKNLNAKFNDIRKEGLIEYALSMGTVHYESETPEHFQDRYERDLSDLQSDREREHITLTFENRKRTPKEVHTMLQEQYNLQKEYLTSEETELYKRIIHGNLGEKIKSLIEKAKKWKDDINALMKDIDTSIQLNLKWSPKNDSHVEISTTRLVKILEKDPETLTLNDETRLSNYFNQKIEEAKETLNESNESKNKSLEDVLRDILDYRKWYQFKIEYRLRGQEKYKDLANNLSKLSGGERAMSMYIPLFSAIHSKYKNASPEAPYIVALDEAFAGVDDDNISEMFQLMEDLEFNYILTSQALWGDYETVSGLAIYEMNLDKATRNLSIVPWLWNGKERKINDRYLDQANMNEELSLEVEEPTLFSKLAETR